MKESATRRRLMLFAVVTILLAAITAKGNTAPNEYSPFTKPVQIRCTCYVDRGTTASGVETREGIIAGKREWLGKTAVLYSITEEGKIGELIGIYEFADTGAGIDTDGDGQGDSIKKGLSVDVWMPSMEAAREWVKTYGDYVFIQVIDAEG